MSLLRPLVLLRFAPGADAGAIAGIESAFVARVQPLQVGGTRLGCVTVSGLPQRDDPALGVQVLAPLCGVPLAEVALGGG